MHVKVNIDPRLKDGELLKGINSISSRLRDRAEQMPKYLAKDVELNWSHRKFTDGSIDPQLVTLGINDGLVTLDVTFSAKGVKNAVNVGEPDAAFWVYQLWDKYLRNRIDHSLHRMDELMSADKE